MAESCIVTKVYTSAEIRDLLDNLPSQIRDDAKQYVFEQLLIRDSKEPGFIQDLHERGALRHYIARMVFIIRHNKNHAVNKCFRIQGTGLTESIEKEEDGINTDYEELLTKCKTEVESLYWYYRDLLKMRVEFKSDRELARYLGLPRSTIQEGLNKARRLVKEKLKKEST